MDLLGIISIILSLVLAGLGFLFALRREAEKWKKISAIACFVLSGVLMVFIAVSFSTGTLLPIRWEDEEFGKMVRNALDKNGQDIYRSDLKDISALYISGGSDSDVYYLEDMANADNKYTLQLDTFGIYDKRSNESGKIKSIADIKHFPDLTNLHIVFNQVEDLSPLRYCPNLKELTVSHNSVSDLSGVETLTNLNKLLLNHNQIKEISQIKDLTKLETLHLHNNEISDVSFISNLTSLTTLALDSNKISEVPDLTNHTQLRGINLYNNCISDISFLSGATSLDFLGLDYNKVADLTPLKSLSNLTTLALHDNKILDLTPISSLPSLTKLHLSYNLLTDLSPLNSLSDACEVWINGNPLSNWSSFTGKAKVNSDASNILIDATLVENEVVIDIDSPFNIDFCEYQWDIEKPQYFYERQITIPVPKTKGTHNLFVYARDILGRTPQGTSSTAGTDDMAWVKFTFEF